MRPKDHRGSSCHGTSTSPNHRPTHRPSPAPCPARQALSPPRISTGPEEDDTILRILIADDHDAIRYGFGHTIESKTKHKIVGEARTGNEAVSLAREKKPDLIVMDASMPGMDGAEATRRILAIKPDTLILAASAHDEEIWIRRMLSAGARGFHLKASSLEAFVEAVETVAAGTIYLDPGIANVVVRDFIRLDSDGAASGPSSLSDRDRDMLRLIAQGQAVKEIAARLGISHQAVYKHRARLMKQLKIGTLPDLVKYAAGVAAPT